MRKNLQLSLLIWVCLCPVSIIGVVLGEEFSPNKELLIEWHSLLSKIEGDASKGAVITTIGVHPPVGRWFLLKRNEDFCAVKFISFKRGHPENLTLNREEESFYAKYHWAHRSNGWGSLFESNTEIEISEASKKPNFWRFLRGNDFVECGPLVVKWTYPVGVSLIARNFNPNTNNLSNEIQIALTGWKQLSEVNINDNRLVWEQYDPDIEVDQIGAKGVFIPIDELPR